MSTVDNNVWYQMIESRVDYNSSWYAGGSNDTYFAATDLNGSVRWQLYHIENDIYQIRNKAWKTNKQLSVCYVSTENDPSKTQPCGVIADGNKTQQWNISPWGDGTYRIFNVANGSDTTLDVHPGNPPFISTNISQTPTKQVAQHWMMQKIDNIDDATYSTQVTALAQAAATSTPSASTSSGATQTTPTASGATSLSGGPTQSGLSSGAQAGIGVGVAIIVIGLMAIFGFLLYRRRKNARRSPAAAELTGAAASAHIGKDGHKTAYQELGQSEKPHEMYSGPATAELPSAPVYSELHGNSIPVTKHGE